MADLSLEPDRLAGVTTEDTETALDGATCYIAEERGDQLLYEFESGALAGTEWLTYDLLHDGSYLAKWRLSLQEGEDGPRFDMEFGALNRCEARVRVPLDATNQNRWKYDREGAWVKPLVGGERVDLGRVDRLSLTVVKKSDEPVRWCQTPVRLTTEEPPKLDDPLLPDGALMDEFGQSTIHEWEGRTENEGELTGRLESQLDAADEYSLPESFSEWGGWRSHEFEATGFFRTEHDGERWWLVDPDGHPFWSAGLDCVRSYIDTIHEDIESTLKWIPEAEGEFADTHGESQGKPMINYLAANFIRVFGEDWHDAWATIALSQLRRFGFNTVANWSDWELASEAGYPYVRPLTLHFPGTESIYRDFPDVFAAGFRESAAAFAEQLEGTIEDPAMIGYFLGNEPTWGFAEETPAAGMLYTTDSCVTREELRDFFESRYGSPEDLAEAWGMEVSFADLEAGEWTEQLTEAAESDLEQFSEVMVEEFYRVLGEECEKVDPNHLNLGTRYAFVPGEWAIRGMAEIDVFSINCYQERVREEYAEISETLDAPVLVGEWHFGALDVGLPASGIRSVADQEARGDAYRVYLEDAAAKPWCVGVHNFKYYDESALGRFDGENWNIGFLDTCNRPYEPLADAARRSHERLYDVASGEEAAYDDAPEYRPPLF